MSAPNLLPGMRPLSPASDYSFEYVQRDRAQWAAEVERLRAEVQRLTAERDEAEARHENELRTRLDHVGAVMRFDSAEVHELTTEILALLGVEVSGG